MSILFYISIITALFITVSTAPLLGITQVVTASFTPMTVYIVLSFCQNRKNYFRYNYNATSIKIIVLAIFIIIFKYSLGQDYFKNVLQLLLIPMFISVVFEELTYSKINILKKLIVLFFIIECSLAIYERIFYVNLFQPSEDDYFYENWTFRSTSLLGHPLNNAMTVTTILSFILMNERMNIKNKLFYFVLGYVSLFCFNARGATIIATLFMVPYIISLIHKTNNRHLKIIAYLLFLICGYIIIYLLFNTSLGGRLLNQNELIDGSAETRLDVFSFYTFISTDDLLWGSPDLYMFLTNKLGAGGVENGIIVLIINYGLIFTIPMVVLLVYFHWKKLSLYKNSNRLWIMGLFYIIGTMNPNLATPMQWTIWLLSYYAFRNATFSKVYL